MGENQLKIAILYIAIGKYNMLWKDFYISCEQYFIKDVYKQYFVFSDNNDIYNMNSENITMIKQEDMGWPDNTLLRFKMFKSIINKLEAFDYIFFFNANLLFLQEVSENFLPDNENLLVALHPSYYKGKCADEYPYCRNRLSKAYIHFGQGEIYVQGALNGGKSKDYIALITELNEAVDEDRKNGIVADVHDESHLNRYILGRNDLKIVGPEYIYPEGWELATSPIILSRDKDRYFNVDKLKKKKIVYMWGCLKKNLKKYVIGRNGNGE